MDSHPRVSRRGPIPGPPAFLRDHSCVDHIAWPYTPRTHTYPPPSRTPPVEARARMLLPQAPRTSDCSTPQPHPHCKLPEVGTAPPCPSTFLSTCRTQSSLLPGPWWHDVLWVGQAPLLFLQLSSVWDPSPHCGTLVPGGAFPSGGRQPEHTAGRRHPPRGQDGSDHHWVAQHLASAGTQVAGKK